MREKNILWTGNFFHCPWWECDNVWIKWFTQAMINIFFQYPRCVTPTPLIVVLLWSTATPPTTTAHHHGNTFWIIPKHNMKQRETMLHSIVGPFQGSATIQFTHLLSQIVFVPSEGRDLWNVLLGLICLQTSPSGLASLSPFSHHHIICWHAAKQLKCGKITSIWSRCPLDLYVCVTSN